MDCSTRLAVIFCFCGSFLLAQNPSVNRISFEGNKKTKAAYLKRLLTLQAGDALDTLQLKEDILRILREPAVSHAYYNTSSSTSGTVDITLFIEENKTLIPAVDVWTTLDQKVAFHLGINDYNFLGQGLSLGAFYRKNIFPGFGIRFENNNFLHWSNELKFIAQQQETLEPIKINTQTERYRYRLQMIELEWGKAFDLYHRVSLSLGRIYERYIHENSETITNLPANFKTAKTLGKLGFTYNKIEPYYYYFKGWSAQSYFTYVVGQNVEGDQDFYQFEIQGRYFKRLLSSGNLAVRGKIGLARNTPSPFPPFVIDNNQNVRGVGNLIQRGNALWVFNAEYRQTVFEKNWFVLQWTFFTDHAGIQSAGAPLQTLFKKENRHHFAGVGLRFIHKYIYKAVLRVDYGIALNDKRQSGLVFGIDQYF